MPSLLEQLRRGERLGALRTAASLPQIASGFLPQEEEVVVKKRQERNLELWRGSTYLGSLGTRDPAKADELRHCYVYQEEARGEGVVDARQSLATDVIDDYLDGIPLEDEGARALGKERLERIRGYVEDKRIADLAGKGMVAVEREMRKVYAHSVVQTCIKTLGTAVRQVSLDNGHPIEPPWATRKEAPGRERVISPREHEAGLSWAADRNHSAPLLADRWAAHRKMIFERLLELGIGTGTRGGRFAAMAYEGGHGCGYVDLATGIMHRVPPGAATSALKAAPALKLPPKLLGKVRRWRAEDGPDQPYIFRRFNGKPADLKYLEEVFKDAMDTLGIAGVVLHTCRHTTITRMIEKGVPASIISAVVGISIQMLRRRYNHSDDMAVQPLAHPAMDGLLGD